MTIVAALISAVERLPLPDAVTAAGVSALCSRTKRRLTATGGANEAAFAAAMDDYPIATHTDDANAQHYELPPEFFAQFLGPRRKYSCCLYPAANTTLAEAEEAALAVTVERAALADGQSILELGCGWGSLSLYMAERYPSSRITAVSNSAPQRSYIEGQAAARGLTNLRIITADMNAFATDHRHDRVVSVEMFEHMSNWRALLARVRGWLNDDGRLFLHVFSHKAASYRFDHRNKADWIAQYFFTGGIMPSHALAGRFPDLFTVEADWSWNGTHYARTALDWLAAYDANIAAIRPILKATYGPDAGLWERRWRLFFLATAGLFGHSGGTEWQVSHYRLAPAP